MKYFIQSSAPEVTFITKRICLTLNCKWTELKHWVADGSCLGILHKQLHCSFQLLNYATFTVSGKKKTPQSMPDMLEQIVLSGRSNPHGKKQWFFQILEPCFSLSFLLIFQQRNLPLHLNPAKGSIFHAASQIIVWNIIGRDL